MTFTTVNRERLASEISTIEAVFLPESPAQNTAIQAACEAAQRADDDALLGRVLSLRARVEIVQGRLAHATETVEQALAAFGRLEPVDQLNLSGPYAEAWRVAGNARVLSGRVAAGLSLLERAVAVAEHGLSSNIANERGFSAIPATSAVVRCLNNLGSVLNGVNERKSGLAMLRRALDAVNDHPEALTDIPDDVVLVVGNLVAGLTQQAETKSALGDDPVEDMDAAARVLAETAEMVEAVIGAAPGDPRIRWAVRHYRLVFNKHLRLTGQLDEALARLALITENRHEGAWLRSTVELELAEVKLAIGQAEAALVHANTALEFYNATPEIEESGSVHLLLSRIYRHMGQHDKAIVSLEKYHQLRGRLNARAAEHFGEHMAAKVALAAARAETEEQRRISTELRTEAALLTQARIAADAASEAKSSFLASMSHELRTPLNAILGFSEMMRDGLAGPPSSKWQDYAASVNDAGSHLLALIDEILDLSKIEAGRVTLEIEPIELPRLFHACTEITSPMMARAQVTFDTVCAQTVSIIQADPVRLKQIILNLLSNAAKFTLPGGRIELSAIENEDNSVVIRVSDTGIGMTTEQVSKALEVFGQIDSEVARRHRGSGLGLPIAAGLAELHGGRLVVDSAPGIGTAVTVTLPNKSKKP